MVAAVLAVLLVLAGGWLWPLRGGAPRAPVGWQLIDGRGQTVTARDYPGKCLLVYFGYTNCPDICPTALQTTTAALGKLGRAAARLQPLFITVDPARDTAAAVTQCAALFSPRLTGLSGTSAEIARAEHGFHVYAQAEHDAGQAL